MKIKQWSLLKNLLRKEKVDIFWQNLGLLVRINSKKKTGQIIPINESRKQKSSLGI